MDEQNFDLPNSSKNYLFAPLKLVSSSPEEASFAYELDIETILSFTEKNLASRTLKQLIANEQINSADLEKAVFFSRFDP